MVRPAKLPAGRQAPIFTGPVDTPFYGNLAVVGQRGATAEQARRRGPVRCGVLLVEASEAKPTEGLRSRYCALRAAPA